jgi:hypothetical protein
LGCQYNNKSLHDLTPSQFENLVFDLVQSLGLSNAVWRTPGRDRGRDIQGVWSIEDMSGYSTHQSWYIECKHFKNSVSWPKVWEKIAFAESNSADVLLFVVSSSLSPQAVDEVNQWNAKQRGVIIRFWGQVELEAKLRLFPSVSIKYGLSPNPQVEVGGALLPLINILLKFSAAAHSSRVFHQDDEAKMTVVFSLAEMISARLEEIEQSGRIQTARFREDVDGFDWLTSANIFDRKRFDRYGVRVIASYLKHFTGDSGLNVLESDGSVFFSLSKPLPKYVLNDLVKVGVLSSIEVLASGNDVQLRRNK